MLDAPLNPEKYWVAEPYFRHLRGNVATYRK